MLWTGVATEEQSRGLEPEEDRSNNMHDDDAIECDAIETILDNLGQPVFALLGVAELCRGEAVSQTWRRRLRSPAHLAKAWDAHLAAAHPEIAKALGATTPTREEAAGPTDADPHRARNAWRAARSSTTGRRGSPADRSTGHGWPPIVGGSRVTRAPKKHARQPERPCGL